MLERFFVDEADWLIDDEGSVRKYDDYEFCQWISERGSVEER